MINNLSSICNEDCTFAGMDLVLLSTLVSLTLAQDLTVDQLNILSAFLQTVGENLSIISTSKDICQNSNNYNT